MKQQPLVAYTVRETKGKSFWVRIGVAFPMENGGMTHYLDAMPASVDGQYKIVTLPPKAEDIEAEGASE